MSRRLLLTPLVLALGLAGAARAETLLQVYEAARAFDATYLAARAQAEAVPFATEQAKALRRPSVGLAGSASRTEREPDGGARIGGTTTGVTLQGRQPLFNRANGATIDQAEKQLDISRATLETAEQELIVRVAQTYFDVLAAQDTLAAAKANNTAITEQLASAKRNFEVGTATITDTREAQARFDLSTAEVLAAENVLRTARAALDQLVGRAEVSPNPLSTPVSLPAIDPDNPAAWVSTAQSQHPRVRSAQLALDIAQLETDKARAGHLPTVDLTASLGTSRGSGTLAQLQGASGTSTTGTVGVQLNVPLFAGFAVQNRIKETLTLEEKSRNDLEAARRGVSLATRQAFLSLESRIAQVKALEAAEASSKLALEATQLGYKVGVRINIDVLNAQTVLFQTQRDLARARYDVLVGALRLRQAAGTLTPPDLAALSRLTAQ